MSYSDSKTEARKLAEKLIQAIPEAAFYRCGGRDNRWVFVLPHDPENAEGEQIVFEVGRRLSSAYQHLKSVEFFLRKAGYLKCPINQN